MNQDKLKVFLLLAFMGIVCAVVLLIVLDTYVPIDSGRSNPRASQIAVRATTTQIPSTLMSSSLSPSTPTITLSPYPTRIEDATPIPTPIFIPINPPYSP